MDCGCLQSAPLCLYCGTEIYRERWYTWAKALACVTNIKICIEEDEMYVTLEWQVPSKIKPWEKYFKILHKTERQKQKMKSYWTEIDRQRSVRATCWKMSQEQFIWNSPFVSVQWTVGKKERTNKRTNERVWMSSMKNLAKFMSKSPNWNLVQKCIDIGNR